MRFLGSLFLISIAPGLLFAQLPFVDIGLKGGLSRSSNLTPPLTFGPYAEFKLPGLVNFESGILWKRYAYPGINRSAYEIPVLIKKRIGPFPVQPFLSAGATLLKVEGLERRTGLTGSVGFTVNTLVIKIEPELRMTRYGAGALPQGRNQVELLFGIRF